MTMKQAVAVASRQNPRTGMSWEAMPWQNDVLAALPAAAQQRLFPHLQPMFLSRGTVLKEAGCALKQVFFPVDCILSLLHVMEDGGSAGVLLVGNDGLLGSAVCMGGENSQSQAIVLSAGYAFGLFPQRLKDEFDNHSDMRAVVLRYTQALMTQIGQTAVCNRHHSIDQQLCRWLLLLLDRLPSNCLILTQELMANMLGVRRESVTSAAGKLQKIGVIEYRRGNITVIDRPQLEKLACECYEVVRETERLLSYHGPYSLPKRFSGSNQGLPA
jgi:CRP-like cAMP-binding protein